MLRLTVWCGSEWESPRCVTVVVHRHKPQSAVHVLNKRRVYHRWWRWRRGRRLKHTYTHHHHHHHHTSRRGRLRSSTSSLLDVRPSRCVKSAIGRLLLPALDFGTVYLLTSGLPRHLQQFVKSWKLIYSGNLTQTLCYNYVAIVVLEVTLT